MASCALNLFLITCDVLHIVSTRSLISPFDSISWPAEKKAAVDLFEEWHEHLKNRCSFSSGKEAKEAFLVLKTQILNKEPQHLIPPELVRRIEHGIQTYDIPSEWFYSQLDTAHYFYGGVQFDDAKALKAFVSSWNAPHAYLHAKLMDAAYTWQRVYWDELSMAFFIVEALLNLPADISSGRLFIPKSEAHQAGVELEMLKKGELSPGVERLLWKQTIRARDAFAQGQPLLKELDRAYRGRVKKNWLTGLEYINEIERRKYNVWSEPIGLTGVQKFQVLVLSWIGKGARYARG